MSVLSSFHHAIIAAATPTATAPAATATTLATTAPNTGGSSGAKRRSRRFTGLLGVVIFFVAAFLVVFWLSLIFWVWRDVRSRTQDVILQVSATLLVAVFNLGGLFIYLIVRPRQTLAELYERQLEEKSRCWLR
jgi:hypothetical protein